jgi:hypothetical protein
MCQVNGKVLLMSTCWLSTVVARFVSIYELFEFEQWPYRWECYIKFFIKLIVQ